MFGKLRNDLACRGKYIYIYIRSRFEYCTERKRSSGYIRRFRVSLQSVETDEIAAFGDFRENSLFLAKTEERENVREVDTRAVLLTGRNLVESHSS